MKSSLCVHVPSRDCSMSAPDAWTDTMRGGVKKRKQEGDPYGQEADGGRGNVPVCSRLIEQVKGILRAKHTPPHHSLGLKILECLVRVAVPSKLAAPPGAATSRAVRSAQGLVTSMRAAGCQRHGAVNAAFDKWRGAPADVKAFAAIPDDVLVGITAIVFGLALATRCAEEAFFALTATAHAGRVMRVVDTAEVATDFASATGDAGLVNAFMLATLVLVRSQLRGGLLLAGRDSRASGTGFGGPGCRLSGAVRGHVNSCVVSKNDGPEVEGSGSSRYRGRRQRSGARRWGVRHGGIGGVQTGKVGRQLDGAEEKRGRRARRQAARQQAGLAKAVDGRVVAIER